MKDIKLDSEPEALSQLKLGPHNVGFKILQRMGFSGSSLTFT
jgi:hypothetical protein